jgi:glycosyltransferase involved in cell wall biosynthesis
MQDPLVSVIMPAYNVAKTIAESIDSVLRQSYKNYELIVIDDGSSDNTAEIVLTFKQKDSRLMLINLSKNGGLSNARNEGCRIARGEYIAFLDSDDLWLPEKLRKQIDFHLSNPDIHISHADYHFFDTAGIHKRPLKYLIDLKKDKEGYIYPQICYKNTIGVLTVMLRKDLLNDVGLFDTSLKTMEDQDLWVRIGKKKKFGYINEALAHYRLSESGISKQVGKYKKAYKRFIIKILSNEKVKLDLMWRNYYRYFGTIYFHKGNLFLSRLYFWKSIMLRPYDYIAISTYLYLAYTFVKGAIKELMIKLSK